MSCFQWISARALPAGWDLRRCGWHMVSGDADQPLPMVRLVDASDGEAQPELLSPALRPRAIALGLGDSGARSRWLAMGYGDAVPGDAQLSELSQRAARTLAPSPARRHDERLSLDLIIRDARVDGRRLYLHPREFALLWRLSEAHGARVSSRELLRDVFELTFDPGTNRLAVHICRLRKKLAIVGLADLLQTATGESGYRLITTGSALALQDRRGHEAGESGETPQHGRPDRQFAPDPQFMLDPPPRLGDHSPVNYPGVDYPGGDYSSGNYSGADQSGANHSNVDQACADQELVP